MVSLKSICHSGFCCHGYRYRREYLAAGDTGLSRKFEYYNEERSHSGTRCCGKTPAQTFAESKDLAKDKQLDIIGRIV